MVEDKHCEHYDFHIKLCGAMTSVDVATFIDMIGNLSVAIHNINEDIQSNKSLKITIKTIEPGSFDIFLSIKEKLLDTIFKFVSKDGLTASAQIVGIIVGLLNIRKLLAGEKPSGVKKADQQTIIINGDGNTVSVSNKTYEIFSEDHVVDAAIGKCFDVLESDDSIDAFTIQDSNKKELFSALRKDFQRLSLPAVKPEQTTRIKCEDAVLSIFKVIFEAGFRWQFYYQGNKISAYIKDEVFFGLINSGTRFGKGDYLMAELQITQVFDNSIQTYVNKEYTVVKVVKHIPRSEQKPLL